MQQTLSQTFPFGPLIESSMVFFSDRLGVKHSTQPMRHPIETNIQTWFSLAKAALTLSSSIRVVLNLFWSSCCSYANQVVCQSRTHTHIYIHITYVFKYIFYIEEYLYICIIWYVWYRWYHKNMNVWVVQSWDYQKNWCLLSLLHDSMIKTYGDSKFQVTTMTVEGYHTIHIVKQINVSKQTHRVADCWSLVFVLGPASQGHIPQRVPSRGSDLIHGNDHQSTRGLGFGDDWGPTAWCLAARHVLWWWHTASIFNVNEEHDHHDHDTCHMSWLTAPTTSSVTSIIIKSILFIYIWNLSHFDWKATDGLI